MFNRKITEENAYGLYYFKIRWNLFKLKVPYSIRLKIPIPDLKQDFYYITNEELVLKEDFQWDGCTGSPFKSKNTLRASAVHDALCDSVRNFPELKKHKLAIDKLFRKILLQDGVKVFKAWTFYYLVRLYSFFTS